MGLGLRGVRVEGGYGEGVWGLSVECEGCERPSDAAGRQLHLTQSVFKAVWQKSIPRKRVMLFLTLWKLWTNLLHKFVPNLPQERSCF